MCRYAVASAGENDDAAEDAAAEDAGGFGGFKFPGSACKDKLAKVAAKRAEAEAAYVTSVAAALPAHKRARLSKLLSHPRMSPGWEGDRDPLRQGQQY